MKELSNNKVMVFGDSVSKGVVYDGRELSVLDNGVVKKVTDHYRVEFKNISVYGQTLKRLYDRRIIDKHLKEMSDEDAALTYVVLVIGGNDCDFDWKAVADTPEAEHQPKTPVAVFADVLHEFVSVVSRAGGTPVLCTLPPIDCARYFAWITRDGLNKEHILRFLGVQERIYRWQEYYSTVALRVAAQTNSLCLPLREAFLERVRGEDVLCEDGIHPNALGHRIIAETAMRGMVKCGFMPCT